MKFGVGQPVRRVEDQTLITGKGSYTDDIKLPNMSHAYVLRAPVAHGTIKSIDIAAAKAKPGVLLVLTAEDVRRGARRHTLFRAAAEPRRKSRTIRRVRCWPSTECVTPASRSRSLSPRHCCRRRTPRRRSRSITNRCPPSRTGVRRSRQMRRNCSTAFRAIWCSTGTTKHPISRRSMRLSPRPRMSPRWRSSTIAWWRTRWSRATRSATGTRHRSVPCCTPAHRARTSCAIRWPKSC